ncbi:MAG: YcxB family protein [Lachnospira sp.]
MVIKNQTKMKKEHIQAVMRAANFDNDRYKKFKLMYNFFGLLFGMMFVRYLIFEMLGSSERQPVMMVLYGIVGAVFLYIGMYGMDKSNYKKYYRIYGNMIGITFTYEADSEGIRMTDEEGDNEFFEWERMLKWVEDLDSFFVYMGMEECLILDKNSFVEGTDINFKELLTAVAGLKKEENGDEYEK